MALAAAAVAAASAGRPADVSELMAQGRESAAVLDALLEGASHGGIGRDLVAEILRCCDRALAALQGGIDVAAGSDGAGAAAAGRKRKSATDGGGATAQIRPKRRARASRGELSPERVEKKNTTEDGFMWRKYGQKGINNNSYPRLYFRCTYKHDRGCPATRQVQQSEDDPSLYVITYFGEHTCCGEAAAAAVDDDGEMQPFVINFGSSTSATATSGSPWFSASSSDDDVMSDTSRSSPDVRLPVEGGREEIRVKVTKAESTTTSDSTPAAELCSSADVSCVVSPALDPLPGCLDWGYLGEISSFDNISKFFNFDEINDLLQ